MEPRACLAHYDAATGPARALRLHAGRGRHAQRSSPAVLGVPPEKMRVVAEEVGGGFGVRFNIYPEYCAALLAREAARPAGEVGRHALRGVPRRRAGARRASRTASSRSMPTAASSACASTFTRQPRRLPLRRPGRSSTPWASSTAWAACTTCQAVYARIRLALTNTAPMAAYRGAGRPVMSYVHRAAGGPGRARARHRSGASCAGKQLHSEGRSFPTASPSGFEYDCGDFAGVPGQGAAGGGLGRLPSAPDEASARAAGCAGAACRPTSRRPAPASRRHDQVEMRFDGRRRRRRCRARRTTTARGTRPPSPRSCRACSACRWSRVRLRTGEPGVLRRRQRHRRLALAARGRQRGAARGEGDGGEGHGARRRRAGGRGRGHRVRDGELPHQGHRPRGRASTSSSRKHPARLEHRATRTSSAPPSRTAATSPRSRSTRRPARRRSPPTSPATTPATSSTTRSSRARCRAA